MTEVGVKEGFFANTILGNWSIFEHYYGIDPYKYQDNYMDGANVDQPTQDRTYSEAVSLLTNTFGQDRITFIKKYSTDAVGQFQNESIDFIYIDARHDYCGAKADIEAFYPIVKCGGLYAGHDYQFSANGQNWALCANGSTIEGSVKRAVLEFAHTKSTPVQSTLESDWASWYFFKKC